MTFLTRICLTLIIGIAAHRAPYNTSARRRDGAINVHFVPHTHNDVGWLKTANAYYRGSQQTIQRARVKDILLSITHELYWNPDRKFSYVEQAFFQRFWDDIDSRTASLVQDLVAAGQLEFINGGFSMHDEANPGYVDMLDQTSLGHRLLKSQFNATPKTTWQSAFLTPSPRTFYVN